MHQSKKKIEKLYCYVDETGQDTVGRFFLVAIVITGKERQIMAQALENIEAESKKNLRKWKKASPAIRATYMEEVFNNPLFNNKVSYAVFYDSRDYQELIIKATAKAIISKAPIDNYETSVYIDGLNKTDRYIIGAGLRRRHVKVKKVRGLNDQSNSLIRLADAVAGFIRDYLEGNLYARELYAQISETKTIQEL